MSPWSDDLARSCDKLKNTDAIYIEMTKDCASNISADDIESQINLVINNGILEIRPSNHWIDSFLISN